MAARGRLRLAAPPLLEVEEDLRGAKRSAADQDEVATGLAGAAAAVEEEVAASDALLGAALLLASLDDGLLALLLLKEMPAYSDSPLSGF